MEKKNKPRNLLHLRDRGVLNLLSENRHLGRPHICTTSGLLIKIIAQLFVKKKKKKKKKETESSLRSEFTFTVINE